MLTLSQGLLSFPCSASEELHQKLGGRTDGTVSGLLLGAGADFDFGGGHGSSLYFYFDDYES